MEYVRSVTVTGPYLSSSMRIVPVGLICGMIGGDEISKISGQGPW